MGASSSDSPTASVYLPAQADPPFPAASTVGAAAIYCDAVQGLLQSTNGAAYAPLGGGGGIGGNLNDAYHYAPAATPITVDAGPVQLNNAQTSGTILGIATAALTQTGALIAIDVDLSALNGGLGNLAQGLRIVGASTTKAKAFQQTLVSIQGRASSMGTASFTFRNTSAVAGSCVFMGWDATNFAGVVGNSVLTGQTHVVTIDGQTNVTAGAQEFVNLRILTPASSSNSTSAISIESIQTGGILLNVTGTGTLSTNVEGLRVGLGGMTAAANRVIGVRILIPGSTSTSTRGIQLTSTQTAGVLYEGSVASTLSAALAGMSLDLATSVTAGSQAVVGMQITLPTTSSASSTIFAGTSGQTAGSLMSVGAAGAPVLSAQFTGVTVNLGGYAATAQEALGINVITPSSSHTGTTAFVGTLKHTTGYGAYWYWLSAVTFTNTVTGLDVNLDNGNNASTFRQRGLFVSLTTGTASTTTGVEVFSRARAGAWFQGTFNGSGGSVALSGSLTGLNLDLSSNCTPGAQTVTGINVTLPASSSSGSTGIKVTCPFTVGPPGAGVYVDLTAGSASGAHGVYVNSNGNSTEGLLTSVTTSVYAKGLWAQDNSGGVRQDPFFRVERLTTAAGGGTDVNPFARINSGLFFTVNTTENNAILQVTNTANVSSNTYSWGGNVLHVNSVPNRGGGTVNLTGNVVSITHAPTGTINTDTTTGLSIAMTPGAAKAVVGAQITMSANATGAALSITHSGTGANQNQLVFTAVVDGTGAHLRGPVAGDLVIKAGINTGTTNGRSVTVQASDGSTTGAGGSVNITAGAAAGSNQNGGNIVLTPTAQTGAGARGLVDFANSASAIAGAVAATLGNTGGATGPATAAQNQWLAVKIGGTINYIPVWQ